MASAANKNNNLNSSATKNYPLAKIPGQTVKDSTPQDSPNLPELSENKLPNNDLFSKELDAKSNEFIDSKIYLFKEYLFRYGRKICPELERIDNKKDEIYEYPSVLFQELYKELANNFDSEYLYKSIQNAYPKIIYVEKAAEQLFLPLQILLGIMLNVYLEKEGQKNYVEKLEKIKNLSVATCYNYMNAAKMIYEIDDERIFSIGLVPLYELYSMYKKGKIKDDIGLSDALMDAFCNLTCSSRKLTDNEFVLAIKYVIFAYKLSPLNIDNKLYNKIFNGKYEWKKRDETFIKSHAYKKGTKRNKEISDPDFVNKYMKALINNDFNGRLARESFTMALPASGSIPIMPPTLSQNMGNPFNITSSVSHLLETLDYHSNNSKQFTKDELSELKIIRDRLNKMNLS